MQKLTTTGQDWANHIAHVLDSNAYLHMIAQFDGPLDADILRRAVGLTLEMQPVLGCWFDESQEPPSWMPFTEISARTWFVDMFSTDVEASIKEFLEDVYLPDAQLILVQLIRAVHGDTLCIKLDHACCDGGGAKAYLVLLCRVYNSLLAAPSGSFDKNNTLDFLPNTDRSSRQIFAACGIADIRQAYRPDKNAPVPSVTFPYLPESSSQVRYERLTIPLSDLRARKNKATMNDLIIAAFMRLLVRFDTEAAANSPDRVSQQAIHVTIDLRRYLDQEQAPVVCNLSGMEKVRVDIQLDEDFDQTLDKVHAQMQQVKNENPGLHSAVSMEFLTQMNFAKAKGFLMQASSQAKLAGKSAPILSNLGFITKEELRLGEVAASRVFVVTPGMHAPAFMLGVSSYGNDMTLVATYFEKEHTAEEMRSFLAEMRNQLC